MTGINNVINVSPDPNKINKQNDVKKAAGNEKGKQTVAAANTPSVQNDQVKISSAAQELFSLETEAKKYVNEVNSSKTLSENEILEIRQKVQNKTYLSAEQIDVIVDKLIKLPNYIE